MLDRHPTHRSRSRRATRSTRPATHHRHGEARHDGVGHAAPRPATTGPPAPAGSTLPGDDTIGGPDTVGAGETVGGGEQAADDAALVSGLDSFQRAGSVTRAAWPRRSCGAPSRPRRRSVLDARAPVEPLGRVRARRDPVPSRSTSSTRTWLGSCPRTSRPRGGLRSAACLSIPKYVRSSNSSTRWASSSVATSRRRTETRWAPWMRWHRRCQTWRRASGERSRV